MKKINIEMNSLDYSSAVMNLIKDSENNEELNKRILGTVKMLMEVPSNLEIAIEIALGASVQNIVIPTEDDAKFLINYLKKMQYGRVIFLPLDCIKPRSIADDMRKYLNRDGVLGVATELISYDDSVKNVFSALLGTTVITKDIDVAFQLARDTKFGFKIVTLDGDVIATSGSVTGGKKYKKI